MRVDKVMSSKAACCRPEDTLDLAAQELWQNDCGCLPVVDSAGILQAMVTDRDICMAAFTTGRPLQEIHVHECMSPTTVYCLPEDPVAQAAKKMAEHQVRRLPVVDGTGKVRGVLSVNDLLRSIAGGAPATDSLTVLTAVARHRGDAAPTTPNPAAVAEPKPALPTKAKTPAAAKSKATTSTAAKSKAAPAAKGKRAASKGHKKKS